jgi:hypothetical protein
VLAALQGLANRYGERFKPDAGWDHFAASTSTAATSTAAQAQS